jgi:hypothetical protein
MTRDAIEIFEEAFEKLNTDEKNFELETQKINGLKRTIESIVTKSKKKPKKKFWKRLKFPKKNQFCHLMSQK